MSLLKGKKLLSRLWLLLLLLLLLTLPIKPQAEQLPIKTYTTADGLARNRINRIVRDSHGFLWFCTDEGLSRFDGYKFTNYTTDQGLPHRIVNDLMESRSGVYWVATGDGVCRFNPTGSRLAKEAMFVVYHPGENKDTRHINVLLEDRQGVIWCGTWQGLYRLERTGDRWAFQVVEIGLPKGTGTDVTALLEDRRGALWAGSGSGLYRRLPDGRTEHYTTQHGLPSRLIRALLEDQAGRLWVGMNYGLCNLVSEPDPSRPVVSRVYTVKDGLPSTNILSLFRSSDERLWIGTGDGLSELIPAASGDGQRFRSYTTTHGLSDNWIFALAEDRDSNLWIGTGSVGAMRMARNGFTTCTESDGLDPAYVVSIFEDRDGKLCVVSYPNNRQLISRFDGQRFTAIRLDVPPEINHRGWDWNQMTLQDRTGQWWVPTVRGLYRFPKVNQEMLAHTRPTAIYTTRDGLYTDEVFRLFEDSRGDIWISTISSSVQSGLTRWERATGTFHRYAEAEGLPHSIWATVFCEDAAGGLWVGTNDNRLAHYADGHFTTFTVENGVPAGWIRALYLDHAGRLWIATSESGLRRLDDLRATQPRFVNYTTVQGLSSNDVWCLTEDQWGRLYIGTGRGLDRLDPVTGHLKHYTAADGLARGELRLAFRDRQGTLWFATSLGLSRLVPEPDRPQSPPLTLISGLRVGGVAYQVSELGETLMEPLELGARQNQMNIDFTGLSFGVGEELRYQYRMEGADPNWSAPAEQRSVNYVNLSPGAYRFAVRTVSADGATSPTPATVAFTILPPLWQRWWFLTLAAMAAGLAVYSLYRYRLARLLELERVRTRIATDLHDDIGSSLSQISVLSEVIHQRLGQDMRVTEPLVLIADLARGLVDSLNDIVWAINPARDRLSDLTQRMRRFASDVFTARDIAFDFRVPGASADIKLGADTRREVFLIFKESVNNLLRHSGCTAAEIEFVVETSQLMLRVRDNGQGFDPEQESDGNGLTSMRQRALRLGGRLEVISNNGEGTTVRLNAPLGRR